MPGNTYPDHILDHARAHGLTAPVPRLTWRRRLSICLLMGALYLLAWALLLVHQLMRGVQWLRVRVAADIAAARHPAPTEPMGWGEFWANVAIAVVGFTAAVGLYLLHLVSQ